MIYQTPLLGNKTYFANRPISSFAAHFHNEMEVLFCVEGDISVVIETTNYHLTDNFAVFVNSMEQHELIVNNKNSKILYLEFGSNLLGDRFLEISKSKFIDPCINLNSTQLHLEIMQRLKDILYSAYSELISKRDDSAWIIKARIFELASIIYRYFPVYKNANLEKQKKIDNYLRIHKVFEWVEKEYQNPLTLGQAAELAGYEVKSFCRLFKRTTGMTFHKYLNQYRIKIALRLLEYNTYSLNEISHYIGIPVVKTFCRNFKEVTGMTPTEYRNYYNR